MTNKPKFETPNLTAENVAKIAALFPGVVVEDKVNFELLRTMLGDEIFTNEAYEFTWVGKRAAIAEAGRPIRKTLRPCPEESRNWDSTENLYIEGDNLDVLKLLQESYLGKVKMIYIDPPYNTGNDFIYRDKWAVSSEEWAEETGELDEETGDRLFKNTETNGRFHSDWCSMIYPRLVLARNLLRDDGVIFISIDDNEQENLKKICDEIFGAANFIAQIVWEKVHTRKNSAINFSTSHEYVLCYAKVLRKNSKDKYGFKRYLLPRDNTDAYSNPDNDPKGPWKTDPITAHNYYSADYEISKPNGIVIKRPQDRYWAYSEESLNRMIAENAIIWGEGASVPLAKRYLCDVQDGLVPITLFDRQFAGDTSQAKRNIDELFEEVKGLFDYTKPVKLLMRILQIATKESDIILDFFSGSATTAHAVMQLNAEDGGNRKFIMVQLPEETNEKSEAYKAGYRNICEIGKERIRRAGEKSLELRLESLEKEGVLVKHERKLSKANGLAKGNGTGNGGVSALLQDTEERALRSTRPNEEGSSFYSQQHSGGASTRNEGVYSVSKNSEGIEGRIGDSIIDKRTFELLERSGYRISDDYVRRNQQNDNGANENSKFSALSSKLSLDIGFRVLKLDDTNMNDVYYAAGDYTQDMLLTMQSNIKEDRTDMDLLFGCLLDWGLPLSMPHTSEKIDGFTVHTYNEGDLIACFEERISEKAVREIASRQPLRVVFRDSSFTSSPKKINVFEIFKLLAPNTTVRVL